jgi:hypothetical protein
MTHSTPLAGAKTVPIAGICAAPNYPISTPGYATVRRYDSSCCLSPILRLFNCPRHSTAPGGHEHRGAIMGTDSFAEAASRSVRMLRAAIRPAITDWLDDPPGHHRAAPVPACRIQRSCRLDTHTPVRGLAAWRRNSTEATQPRRQPAAGTAKSGGREATMGDPAV